MQHALITHLAGLLSLLLVGVGVGHADGATPVTHLSSIGSRMEPTLLSARNTEFGAAWSRLGRYDCTMVKSQAQGSRVSEVKCITDAGTCHIASDVTLAADITEWGRQAWHINSSEPSLVPRNSAVPASALQRAVPLYPSPTFPVGLDPLTQTSGLDPQSVAMADLDADGFLDLVVTVTFSKEISLLLGNDDGTFKAAQAVAMDQRPVAIVVGDVNADRVPDLITANLNDTISVLLGNGDASFEPHPVIDLERFSRPTGITLADLNADGRLDLVAVASNGAVVFLGNGDGSFQPLRFVAPLTNISAEPQPVPVVDLNNDRKLDIITGGLILLGNGDGTFQIAQEIISAPTWVADFNTDGALDLYIPGRFLWGNGDGTFQEPQSTRVRGALAGIVDMNGDGLPDLVSAGAGFVYLSNGDGTFQAALPVATGSRGGVGVVGDVNMDGALDLIRVGQDATVLLGRGDGTFEGAQRVARGRLLALADLDTDGVIDIITHPGTVWHGNGDGTFQEPRTLVEDISSIAVADMNSDGLPDLITAADRNPWSLSVRFGNGDGTFQAPRVVTSDCPCRTVVVDDLNADGTLDLILDLNLPLGNNASKVTKIFLGNGNGNFQVSQTLPLSVHGSVVNDLDGDGAVDLVAGKLGGGMSIWRGNGDGTFQEREIILKEIIIKAVVDVDGDDHPDLISSEDNNGNKSVSVRFGNGDGTFQAPQVLTLGEITGIGPAVVDLEVDGILDIVLNRSFGVTVLLGNGDRTFQAAGAFSIIGGVITTADLDNDGKLDIVAGSDVSVLLQR